MISCCVLLMSACIRQTVSVNAGRLTSPLPVPSLQPRTGSLPGAGDGLQHPLHDEGAAGLPLLLSA